MICFEWDDEKAARNLRIHGIDFRDASLVFDDPFRITDSDSVVEVEERWRTTGVATGIVVLLAVHLEQDFGGDLFVRIISARRATPNERQEYDNDHS